MEFHKNDLYVGAFVAAAFLVLLTTVAVINRARLLAGTYGVEIHLKNIAGVDKGVEVVYQGFKAGAVDRVTIAYEPEFRFIVSLAIKRELRLKRGTRVLVKDRGIGGGKQLELVPPDEDAAGGMVDDGEVLPVMTELDLMAKANEVLGKVQMMVADFQKAGTGEQVKDIVKRSHAIITHLEGILANADALLAKNKQALDSSLARSEDITRRTDELLARNADSMSRTLANVDRALVHLPRILKDAEELMNDLKSHPWKLVRKGGDPAPALDHSHAVESSTGTAKDAPKR